MKVLLEFNMPDDLLRLQAATSADQAVAALMSIRDLARAYRETGQMSPEVLARRISEAAESALAELGQA